jgi:hypothetical protein
MRRLFTISALMITTLAIATPALSQTPQQTPPPSSGASSEEVKPAMTTVSGTTGLWFVPTAEVLQAKKWSASLYRTNVDDGQGFTDVSTFPVTFAYGLGGYGEVFGSWALITRIDRDTRPLFFESTPASIANGTGGGILPDYPLVKTRVERQQARRLHRWRQDQLARQVQEGAWRRRARHAQTTGGRRR